MTVNRLEFERESAEERLANIEKLLLFQEDKINALKQDQEILISWLRIGGYVVVIFQMSEHISFQSAL